MTIPLFVQVSVIPSAEYWAVESDHMPTSAHFAIAVGDASIEGLQFANDWVEPAARAPAQGQLVDTQIVRAHHAVIASGTMKHWAHDEAGVSIVFLAHWLSHRAGTNVFGVGGESCYLSLPTLTGTRASDFASAVFGVKGPTLHTTAMTVSASRHGVVGQRGSFAAVSIGTNASLGRNLVYPSDRTDNDLSIPKPSIDEALGTVWKCSDDPSKLRLSLFNVKHFDRGLAAFATGNSLAALANSGGSDDCSGIAVTNDDDFQTVHDVTLALIGVLFTFGVTLIARALDSR